MGLRKVLVAVDGSPVAAHAAEVGMELARSLGGELGLVHVVDPSLNSIPDGGVPAAELLKQAETDAKHLLASFAERAQLPAPALQFVQVGKPAGEVVKAAKDWPADIIVIGSHGRGGISRAVLGSVAEAVMRHSDCPVLVVRARA